MTKTKNSLCTISENIVCVLKIKLQKTKVIKKKKVVSHSNTLLKNLKKPHKLDHYNSSHCLYEF